MLPKSSFIFIHDIKIWINVEIVSKYITKMFLFKRKENDLENKICIPFLSIVLTSDNVLTWILYSQNYLTFK
jgi:hypothetical protein